VTFLFVLILALHILLVPASGVESVLTHFYCVRNTSLHVEEATSAPTQKIHHIACCTLSNDGASIHYSQGVQHWYSLPMN